MAAVFLAGLLAMVVTLTSVLVESILVLTDPEGRRWGDRWARTRVVEKP